MTSCHILVSLSTSFFFLTMLEQQEGKKEAANATNDQQSEGTSDRTMAQTVIIHCERSDGRFAEQTIGKTGYLSKKETEYTYRSKKSSGALIGEAVVLAVADFNQAHE
jgi:hypothetical protein